MILSNRNGLKNTRNMLRVFGGLNETYSCTEAEYSAGINFSARNFPALSTRLPRRKLREEADLNGMYHLNGLLTVCGRDLVYTPDDADEMEVTLKDTVENGRKTLVGIGTKILIFPDKLAFDTASREVSALGAVWSGKNARIARPALATPSGKRTPSLSTNDRIGNDPSSRSRQTVSPARRTDRNALSSVFTASERTMSRASSVTS